MLVLNPASVFLFLVSFALAFASGSSPTKACRTLYTASNPIMAPMKRPRQSDDDDDDDDDDGNIKVVDVERSYSNLPLDTVRILSCNYKAC